MYFPVTLTFVKKKKKEKLHFWLIVQQLSPTPVTVLLRDKIHCLVSTIVYCITKGGNILALHKKNHRTHTDIHEVGETIPIFY